MGKEIIIALYAGSIMLILLGTFICVFIFYYKKRRADLIKEKELLKTHFQQELLLTKVEIQEQTLKNIAQEIHDNIGQVLSLAKLNLGTINLEKPFLALTKIESSKDLVAKAIVDLRDLAKSLNTDHIVSAGLVSGIQLELELIEKSGILQTEFTVKGDAVRIDPKKELIIFRIVQEAINNVFKHTQASQLTIHAIYEDDYFTVAVKDNGKGFENAIAHSLDGSGLKNMKNRAELIGGTFDIQSGEAGTTIIVIIPIAEK